MPPLKRETTAPWPGGCVFGHRVLGFSANMFYRDRVERMRLEGKPVSGVPVHYTAPSTDTRTVGYNEDTASPSDVDLLTFKKWKKANLVTSHVVPEWDSSGGKTGVYQLPCIDIDMKVEVIDNMIFFHKVLDDDQSDSVLLALRKLELIAPTNDDVYDIPGATGFGPLLGEVDLLPSSTNGHFHLLSNIPIEGREFVGFPGGDLDESDLPVLQLLVDGGIVEPGYGKVSRKRGFTALRIYPKPGSLLPYPSFIDARHGQDALPIVDADVMNTVRGHLAAAAQRDAERLSSGVVTVPAVVPSANYY